MGISALRHDFHLLNCFYEYYKGGMIIGRRVGFGLLIVLPPRMKVRPHFHLSHLVQLAQLDSLLGKE